MNGMLSGQITSLLTTTTTKNAHQQQCPFDTDARRRFWGNRSSKTRLVTDPAMLRRLLTKRLRHVGTVQTTQSAEKHTNGASAYRVLGLPLNATKADIKSAFYRLAKEVHPDSNRNNDVASRRFVDIKRAYETLSRGLSYCYEDKTSTKKKSAVTKNEHLPRGIPAQRASIPISLKQAALGVKGYVHVLVKSDCPKECYRRKKFTGNEKCTTCFDQGYVENKRYIYLDIPPGVQDGQNIILKQPSGGSVEITVFVTPSKEFFRSGDDIYSCETVSLGKALLGGEIVCRGIDGRQTFVKIQPGQDMINLQGHGLGGRGDHLVQLVVKVSTKPSFIFSSVRKMFSEIEKDSKSENNGLMRRPDCSLIPLQTDNHVDVQNELIKNLAMQTMNAHKKSMAQYSSESPSWKDYLNSRNLDQYFKQQLYQSS